MREVFKAILLVVIIYSVGFSVMIGWPMYLTRNNKTIELKKESVSQRGDLIFPVNSVISGEDLTLDLCHKRTRWYDSVRATITVVVLVSGWEVKMSKACTIDNGYCTIKLPSSFVTNEAILMSLEIEPEEKTLHVDSVSLFIGNIL